MATQDPTGRRPRDLPILSLSSAGVVPETGHNRTRIDVAFPLISEFNHPKYHFCMCKPPPRIASAMRNKTRPAWLCSSLPQRLLE